MKKRSIFTSTLVVVVVCLLAASLAMGAPRSRNAWELQVRRQLRAVALLLGLGDIVSTYDPYIGALDNNTYTDVAYTLHKGVSYALIGVCDEDCSDLDLKLYDENGNLIDADTDPDATPTIRVTPRWTGKFYVRVVMSECDENPCWYGVGEFEPAR
jgi:hypothetical protein